MQRNQNAESEEKERGQGSFFQFKKRANSKAKFDHPRTAKNTKNPRRRKAAASKKKKKTGWPEILRSEKNRCKRKAAVI